MLQTGDNVIAVDLWNSTSGTYSLDVAVIPAPVNFTISHIEITQGTQDENNEVPLIARRDALVRVYVTCSPGCGSGSKVSGTLQVSGPLGGTSVSPSPRYIIAHNTSDWRFQREYLDHTLNFIVPKGLLQGDVTLTAAVAGHIVPKTRTFHQVRTLKIAYVPIEYTRSDKTVCKPNALRIAQAASFARKVYPTAEIKYDSGWQPLKISQPYDNCGVMDLDDSRIDELLQRLEQILPSVEPQPDHVFGWLPDDPMVGTGGISYPSWYENHPGYAALAYDDTTLKNVQRVFAHEVGHLLGRRHTNTIANLTDGNCQTGNEGTDQKRAYVDPESDWVKPDSDPTQPPPFPDSKIQQYGLDGSTVKRPVTTYDYMSYCHNSDASNVWTSPWTYRRIYEQSLGPQSTLLTSLAPLATRQYFLVSGTVFTDSTGLLYPVWVITSTAASYTSTIGTEYCLELQNASHGVQASNCFDKTFVNYETGKSVGSAGSTSCFPIKATSP